MTYTATVADISLVSSWRCVYHYTGSWYEWRLLDTPSTATADTTFPVALPVDAVISRAWLTMDITSPLSGSAVQQVNGVAIPSSGEVELDASAFSATMTTFSATFTFRANGLIYPDVELHQASITFAAPTLHIAYTAASQPDNEPDDEPGDGVIVDRQMDAGVQLPRLLGADFTERGRIDPISVRLETPLDPKAMAVMRVPPGGMEMQIGDWVEMFSPHGSAGLFRICEAEHRMGLREESTYQLEHAIATLEDNLAVGVQSLQAPLRTVLATLLEPQIDRHWVLGDCDVPEDYEIIYEYSYDNLLASVMGILRSLPPEYYLDMDTTRHPFVLHVRRLPDTPGCEMRMRRNLTYVTLTIDRSNLCTRLYPFGAGEGSDRMTLAALTGSLHIDSPTAQTWGYVSQTITAGEVYDALTLKAVAERYLERYGAPKVSVVGEATDLSLMTGEALDYFRPGALCQLALPDYGVTMLERVISVVWPDVYNQPLRAEVCLSSRVRDAADELAELIREATHSKLIGGTVETIESSARAGSITPGSPFSQSFEVTGYGNVLNIKTAYRCVTSTGEEVSCHVTVDGNAVDAKDAAARVVDITRYLDKDENGVPTVGAHRVVLQPATVNTMTSEVDNTITIKQIKR